jgi:hypothetical protein
VPPSSWSFKNRCELYLFRPGFGLSTCLAAAFSCEASLTLKDTWAVARVPELSDTEREMPAEYVPTADQRALVPRQYLVFQHILQYLRIGSSQSL